ncbi:MAG: hypothetical protein FJ387_22360 [Verrucomicrobia bacterium]|nr:hypothetical protein [Verrucomicrobiota bacterium]
MAMEPRSKFRFESSQSAQTPAQRNPSRPAGRAWHAVLLGRLAASLLLITGPRVSEAQTNDALGFALQPHAEANAVFDPSTYLTIPENIGSALLDVVIVGDTTTRPVSVGYRTEPIEATPIADYTPVSGTLTFTAGESRKTIAIPIGNDSITEWRESFWLRLQNPAGGLPLSQPRELEIGISDNDRGCYIADANGDGLSVLVLDERAGTVTVNVNRVGDYDFPSSVHYRVATDGGTTYRHLGSAIAGVDFVPTEGTLDYAPNEINKIFTLTVLDDGMIAGDKVFYLTLDEATGGVGIQNPAVQVVIRDCERNPVRIDPDFQPEWPSQDSWWWLVRWGKEGQVTVGPADGKIYLLTPAHRVTGEDGVLALRLLPDGLPDPAWTTAAISGSVAALALQTNGQLLVAASRSASGYYVPEFSVNGVACRHFARLNADGSLDTTFAVSFPTNLWLSALALQADGRILSLMWDRSASRNVAFRLLPSGAVDPTFSSPALSLSRWCDSIAATPDRGIILEVCPSGRLNADGTVDQQFQPPSDSTLLAVQPDGRLLASIFSTTGNELCRLTPEGQLDPTFEPVGLGPDLPAQVLPAADGKLWVLTRPENWLNSSNSDYRLTRRLADGSDDPTWPAAGLQVTSGWLGSLDDPGTAVRLKPLPDGSLLLVSSRPGWVNGQWRASLARLLVEAPLPRFEVDAASARVPENAGQAPISLLRCGPNTEPITVTWRTEGGTARPGVDYVPASGTVTFPADESTATVELEVLDNAVPDADRTVRLHFEGAPPSNLEYPPVELTILNNDPGFARGGIKRFPNGRVWLHSTGVPDIGAQIEASENLRDWHNLDPPYTAWVYPGQPETMDVGTPTNMARFYRLRAW